MRIAAARAWSLWEGETITLLPDRGALPAHFGDDDFAVAFARIENHYFVHARLARGGPADPRRRRSSKDIPGVIIQGRYDIACPPQTAWDLHRAWPEAEFHMVEGAGHAYLRAGHPAPR